MLPLRVVPPAPTDAATDGSQPRLFTEIRLHLQFVAPCSFALSTGIQR